MLGDEFQQRLVQEDKYVLLGAPFHERQYLLAGFDPSGGVVGVADVNRLRISAVGHEQIVVDPELIRIEQEVVDDISQINITSPKSGL